MRIWDQERATNYLKARVYGYNVTDADLRSLKSPNWLTDQVLVYHVALLSCIIFNQHEENKFYKY